MTQVPPRATAPVERPPEASTKTAAAGVSYVDWPAILAGTVIASAVVFLLLMFGGAIGLSLPSAREGEGVGSLGVLIAIGLWSMWATVSGHMIGAYATGRLRRRIHDATEHESEIRDGLHGIVVWGLGLLIGAALLVSGATTATRLGGEAAATATAVLETADFKPQQYLADTLLRSDSREPASVATSEEVMRIFVAAGDDDVPQEDRAYLTSLVANRTGLSEEDARARVDEVTQRFQALKAEAQEAAETARKGSVISAFVVAASLLIAAAGALWAAGLGGRHRDEQVVFHHWSWRR